MTKHSASIPGISIIIPCYNEENNLKRGVLDQVDQFLKKASFPNWEVLICNDASTDNSLTFLKNFCKNRPSFKVIDLPHGGKPSALWGGIQKAKYPWVLFTDMDQSTPLSEITNLIPYFPKYDVVIGSRGTHRTGNSLLRKIGANIFLNLRRFLLLSDITDTQCGFKAIKTNLAKEIFPRLAAVQTASQSSGWRVTAYDVEMLYLAQKWGYRLKEIPVQWQNEDTSTTKGNLNDRYRKESIQMAKEVYRVKMNDLKGSYDPKI
jgi:dolichyl-phosphate beta-glucosyltransferase